MIMMFIYCHFCDKFSNETKQETDFTCLIMTMLQMNLQKLIKIQMQCIISLYKFVCCLSDPKFPVPYNFSFGREGDLTRNRVAFQSNYVRTSKYTWYDFLPKSLLLQFKRLANIYFLIISVLQSIPQISPLGPLTAWGPLIFVLAISILRQGYEDYQRYKSDEELNHQMTTRIFREGEFITVKWSQVIIGDIVRVEQGELIPADLILLSSAVEGGSAFIKTASLDGQNNLKPRNAYPQTQEYTTVDDLKKLVGQWNGIPPDKELHNFSSSMVINSETINFYKDKQLLYRGSTLENTKWIYGLSIYTGRNTKIMMNSESSSQKMSQIEVKVNYILAFILLFQIVLCIIVAVLDAVFIIKYCQKHSYIMWSKYSIGIDSILIWCTYFVLINTMIPISLIVSIQMVKFSQSYFIDKDRLMYSDLRKKGANVKSASLNQQLGQIQYIFTDKTGTLTLNQMEFKIAVIGNRVYGDLGLVYPQDRQSRPPQTEKGFQDQELKELIKHGKFNHPVKDVFVNNKEGTSHIVFHEMKGLAQEYLTALSVAHECVCETNQKGEKFYQGPSPDEITLVEAAKQMGFQFNRATQNTSEIMMSGHSHKFDLLQIFPFNSDRKRMSVVIRSGNLIKMYIKGADSIIKERLAADQKLNLDEQLSDFSKIGLRTLLIGMRIISDREYRHFVQAVDKLPVHNKEEAYNQLVSELQKNIYLIGATAVLDRLQDHVPETIRDLLRANIKIWMLTGDKMQTAENIAKSCNLIQKNFHVLKYHCHDRKQSLVQLQKMTARAQQLTKAGRQKALLIEGQYLSPIIGNPACEAELANLSLYCDSVICCRLLPIQKAEVVRIVRNQLKKITLAIGDGANDVPMIKTAHIGVGLYGQEGMGSVQASDYALPQFRMLWRLLLVHGRWNYMRIAEMILYFFYKNMLFTVPQFIYAFYCGFSGQTLFDDYYISSYNLFFTSLPLVIRAILQQDVYYIRPSMKINPVDHSNGKDIPMRNTRLQLKDSQYIPKDYQINKYLYRLFPKIYFVGQKNTIFNYTNFVFWIVQGIIEAIIITFFCLYIFSTASLNSNGLSNDLWITSITIFTSIILVVTFKLSAHTKFWSVLLFVCIIFFSLGLYIAYMWISNYYFSDYIEGTTMTFYTNAETYLVVIFCICFVLWVDGIMITFDFKKGGHASKMRKLIQQEKEANMQHYRDVGIHSEEVKTIMQLNQE